MATTFSFLDLNAYCPRCNGLCLDPYNVVIENWDTVIASFECEYDITCAICGGDGYIDPGGVTECPECQGDGCFRCDCKFTATDRDNAEED